MDNYYNDPNNDNNQRQPQPPQGTQFGGFFGLPFFPPGMMPGQPSFGPPPGPPPPPGGGVSGGSPPGPPPPFTPSVATAQQTVGTFAVDPGAIRPCVFRYVYIWLENGRQFWAWPIFVGRNSLAGWRWNGFTWVYFGIDLSTILAFVCY